LIRRIDSFFPGNLIPLSQENQFALVGLSSAASPQFCHPDQQFSPPDKVIGIRENH
jgi:hypothetical protein